MDAAAANVLLDAWLGANKAAGMPASFDLALYDGHPDEGGSELATQWTDTAGAVTGTYARVTVANDAATWPAAAGGRKTSVDVTLAGSGSYGTPAKWWVLYSGTTRYFTMPLETEVTEPTDIVTLSIALGDNA